MKLRLLRHYPLVFSLPFLISTTRIESLAQIGELVRWGVLFLGIFLIVHPRLRSSRRNAAAIFPADIAIFAIVISFFLSAFWSINALYSIQRAASFTLLIIVCLWFLWRYADVYSERYLLQSLLYVVAGGMVLSLLAIPIMPTNIPGGRFTGIFLNPNNIGMITGLCIPVAFSLWLQIRDYLHFGVVLVLVAALILSGSRAGFVGAVFGSGMILAAYLGKGSTRSVVIFITITLFFPVFAQSEFFVQNILRLDTLESASNRLDFWELARQYISNRPLLGHGFGSDAEIHQHYGRDLKWMGLRGYGVMSSYYGLVVQMGWFFSIAFFTWLWVLCIRCTFFGLRNTAVVTLGGAIGSGLVICIAEPAIYSAGNAFSYIFWTVVMLAIRRRSYSRNGIRLDGKGALQVIAPASLGAILGPANSGIYQKK